MAGVVIAGGGFAGVWAAMGAAAARERSDVGSSLELRLVSRDPYLTIRPRLYEHPLRPELRVPLRDVLEPLGVRVTLGEISTVDLARQRLQGTRADAPGSWSVGWDALVFACGSRLRKPRWQTGNSHIFCVDTFADAQRLNTHLRKGLEEGRVSVLSAVVVGSGLAGLEVATSLGDRLRGMAVAHGHDPSLAQVTLVEAGPLIAADFDNASRRVIAQALEDTDVRRVTGTAVQGATSEGVVLDSGDPLPAGTVIWTGGLEASPLTSQVSRQLAADGRIPVSSDLRPRDHAAAARNVFVAGDSAEATLPGGHHTVMSCQQAMPLGRLAGYNAAARLLGLELERVSLPEYVTCVDLGSAGAVLTRGWNRRLELSGSEAKDVKRTIMERLIYPPVRDRLAALAVGGGAPPAGAEELADAPAGAISDRSRSA